MPSKRTTTTRLEATAAVAAAFIIAVLAVVGAAHATVFPALGGKGDRAEELRCPQGRILVGFHGKTGSWIDQIGLICATFLRPAFNRGGFARMPAKGGNGGARNEQYCIDDAAIRKIELLLIDEKFVQTVRFSCLRPRDGSDAEFGVFGGDKSGIMNSSSYSNAAQGCSGSEYAVGLTVRYGAHVNAVGLICGPVQDPSGGFGAAGSALDRLGTTGERIEAGMENNTDRPGWDYQRIELSSRDPSACQNACKSDGNRCRAWTYVRPGVHGPKPVCYLKSQQPDAKADACCISGVNKKVVRLGKIPPSSPTLGPGMENDTDRPGSDIHRMELQEANPGICQARCAKLERCKAWTYVRPGVQVPKAVCYLKSAVPAPAPNKCCISGVKDAGAGPDAPSDPEPPSPSASGCREGFVPRKAQASDDVCVTEESYATVQEENATAPSRWDPNGAYGPYTCISGYVWREAFDGDTVCVTPGRRAAVKEETRLGPSRAQ